MNQRIRELAEQAFQPINDMTTEGVADRWTFEQPWFQMYSQALARLIVQECCDIFVELRTRPADLAVKDVKKHFGVDE